MPGGKIYQSGQHLRKLRLRTFFQKITVDSTIQSEGAYAFDLYNIGDDPVTLLDASGVEFNILPSITAFSPPFYDAAKVTFPGSPEMVRDDNIELVFDRTGINPLVIIAWHRVVKSRDEMEYPVLKYSD